MAKGVKPDGTVVKRGQGNSLYKPEFCDLLINWMKRGFTLTTFPCEIERHSGYSVVIRVVYQWIKEHPEFAEAYEIAKQKAQEFFEKLLLASITGVIPEGLRNAGSNGINLNGVNFILKTRFAKDYGQVYKVTAEMSGDIDANKLEGRLRLEGLSDETIKLMIRDAKIKERDNRNAIPVAHRDLGHKGMGHRGTGKRTPPPGTGKRLS